MSQVYKHEIPYQNHIDKKWYIPLQALQKGIKPHMTSLHSAMLNMVILWYLICVPLKNT